ncbi:hypothetical protein Q7P37_010972 [Cladosporium fusiforme]
MHIPRGNNYKDITVKDNARAQLGDVHGGVHNYYAASAVDPEAFCRRALFLTDPAVDRQRLIDSKGQRVERTCEWIERREQYQKWLSGRPQLIWIRGGPGKGKTMLSIYLTQQLEVEHSDRVIYFFCSSGDQNLGTATAVLRTLIWQLVTKNPQLTHHILSYFDVDCPDRTQSVLSTKGVLWEMVTKLLSDESSDNPRHFYYVVDGFDECDTESMQWLALQFAQLEHLDTQIKLRVLIISRTLHELRFMEQIRVDPDNDEEVRKDIMTFAFVRVQELTRRLGLSDDFSRQIQDELIRKAENTFLWIGYAMSELLTKRTSAEITKVVSDLPLALPALYRRMVQCIPPDNRTLCIQALCSVVWALEPLTLEELTILVSDLGNKKRSTKSVKRAVALCEPLIRFQQRIVRIDSDTTGDFHLVNLVVLVHQSAKDFLLSAFSSDEVGITLFPNMTINLGVGHRLQAESCIKALTEDNALSELACRHWFEHLRLASEHAPGLIREQEMFFREGSAVFARWWKTYSQHVQADTTLQAVMESKSKGACATFLSDYEQPSRLDIACYLGLKAWAEAILSEENNQQNRHRRQFWPNRKAKVPQRTPETALQYAVRGGQPHMIEYLLAKGISAMQDLYPQPMTLAIFLNQLETVELLRDHGVALHSEDMFEILTEGSPRMARFFLEHGANPNFCRPRLPAGGHTPLQEVASNGSRKLAKLLLAHGADPNADRAVDGSPLCIAIMRNDIIMAEMLLDNGASPVMDFHEPLASPLFTTLQYLGHCELAHYLSGLPPGPGCKTLTLWSNCLHGDQLAVLNQLRDGASPNATTNPPFGGLGGFTSLHWTVLKWSLAGYNQFTRSRYGNIVQLLLERSADPDLHDTEGKSALDYAGADGRIREVVLGLVKEHFRRTNQNSKGFTSGALPLHEEVLLEVDEYYPDLGELGSI